MKKASHQAACSSSVIDCSYFFEAPTEVASIINDQQKQGDVSCLKERKYD